MGCGIVMSAVRNRTHVFVITIKDGSGVPVELAAGDKIRLKIGRQGSTPRLDLLGGESTAAGSVIENLNPARFTLAEGDTVGWPIGNLEVEALVVDSSVGNLTKHAETGILTLAPEILGDLGQAS